MKELLFLWWIERMTIKQNWQNYQLNWKNYQMHHWLVLLLIEVLSPSSLKELQENKQITISDPSSIFCHAMMVMMKKAGLDSIDIWNVVHLKCPAMNFSLKRCVQPGHQWWWWWFLCFLMIFLMLIYNKVIQQ